MSTLFLLSLRRLNGQILRQLPLHGKTSIPFPKRVQGDQPHATSHEAKLVVPRAAVGLDVTQGEQTCVDICPPLIRIAEKRLRRYSNARCLLGRIETHALDPGSFDRIVIHNALHDIPDDEREKTVAELARVLKPAGKLYLREPVKPSHGATPDGIRALMNGVGIEEERSSEYKLFPIGPVYDAVFAKEG